MTTENTEEAFCWIIGILKSHNVPFQITGGLAAKIYGSSRPLNDIDIDVPDDRFSDIVSDVKPHIVYGPLQFSNERWDELRMVLNYKGQEIDISGGCNLRICDAITGQWQSCQTDFSNYEEHEIYGIKVPVIPRQYLVEYKRILVGEHQKVDIKAIEDSLSRK